MRLARVYVMFSSTFDGEDLEAYARELVEQAPDAVETAWSDCVGFPGLDAAGWPAGWNVTGSRRNSRSPPRRVQPSPTCAPRPHSTSASSIS